MSTDAESARRRSSNEESGVCEVMGDLKSVFSQEMIGGSSVFSVGT